MNDRTLSSDAELEGRVQEILEQLKTILDQIGPKRVQVDQINAQLVEVQRDYEQRMREVNLEADELEWQRQLLLDQLETGKIDETPRPPTQEPPEPNPPEEEKTFKPAENAGLPEIPPEPPQRARKRVLASHIYYFSEDESVIQAVNAVLADDKRDLGDILEILPWGAVWTSRALEWEKLADQVSRLEKWLEALQTRLDYWNSQIQRLEMDGRYPLLVEKRKNNGEAWLLFLDQLATGQASENKRLAQEIARLQALIEQQHTSEGTSRG